MQNGHIALRKQTTCLQVPSIDSGLTVLFNGLRHLFDLLGSRKELVSKKRCIPMCTADKWNPPNRRNNSMTGKHFFERRL